jgi:uncharacterized membrane protein
MDSEEDFNIFFGRVAKEVNLDLLNLSMLAYLGIIIKLFFKNDETKLGHNGPASTNIWGYGLTALAVFIMIFISLSDQSKTKSTSDPDEEEGILTYVSNLVMTDTLPIILTFCILVYIIILNFKHYYKINQGKVADSYYTYSLFSSILIIVQISIICKYMFNTISNLKDPETIKKKNIENPLLKNLIYILSTINIIFVLIIHILLYYFSTDG